MIPWQKRARRGAALVGAGVLVAVYATLVERQPTPPPPPVERLDPRAIAETTAGFLQRLQGAQPDFEVTFASSLLYDDNSVRYTGVRITPRDRAGRSFVIHAREAQAREGQRLLALSGAVRLSASDGFELLTESATFDQADGTAAAAGTVAFSKGRMNGTGRNVTYETRTDVLRIDGHASVSAHDSQGRPILDFAAVRATLDRNAHLLTLDEAVRILRAGERFEGDRAEAQLTDANDVVTFIRLQGRARVAGGGEGRREMAAREIALDYSDDGLTLERVSLAGKAVLVLAGEEGRPGREVSGERLDLEFDPDGGLNEVVGTGRVRFTLPGDPRVPVRTIEADRLDAAGEPGRGLTEARFTGSSVFREAGLNGTAPRLARADTIHVTFDGDAVGGAHFAGLASFEERSLSARAGTLVYRPDAGTLQLSGADSRGDPAVADARVSIQARTMTVTLTGPRIRATGRVRTIMWGSSEPAAGADRTSPPRLPGILVPGEAASVTADDLVYDAAFARASYEGAVTVSQRRNAIRASRVVVDQDTGNLDAAGNVRTQFSWESGDVFGRADSVRYDDAARRIVYAADGIDEGALPRHQAQLARAAELRGPHGDLEARRIVVSLGREAARMERVDASGAVRVRISETRTAAAAGLAYVAEGDRYELTGTAQQAVTLVDLEPPNCRETTGRALIFHRSADRILVDGQGEARTASHVRPCQTAVPR